MMTLLRSFVTFSYYCGFVLVCIYVVVSSSDGEVVALLSHAATATVLFCVFTLIPRIYISSSDDDIVALFCHIFLPLRFCSCVYIFQFCSVCLRLLHVFASLHRMMTLLFSFVTFYSE